jgi:lysophospholipase L1-like esterase
VQNITQNTYNTYTLTDTFSNFNEPNSSVYKIAALGGTFDIQNIRLVSRSTISPKVVVVGDSKSASGKPPGDIGLRWPSLINSIGPVDVFAGASDRTVEVLQDLPNILSLHPQYVIINIGRNDISSGVSTATWEANYASIISQLKAAGITVIHLLPIPEPGTDQTTLTNYINSTYPNDVRIDVSGSWSNSIDLAADNVHPSAAGGRLIASLVLAKAAYRQRQVELSLIRLHTRSRQPRLEQAQPLRGPWPIAPLLLEVASR